MSIDRRWVGRAFLVVSFTSMVFVACATGNQQETSATTEGSASSNPSTSSGGGSGGGGMGGSGGSGGALPMGTVGSVCTSNDDCTVGKCTVVGNKKYCTVPCPPDCPTGTYCSLIDGDSICIPDLGQQCAVCSATAACPMPTDKCFKAPLGDSFCGRDCTKTGACANGFTCMNGDAYVGGSGSGGGVDGGAPDGGNDAGNDAGKDGGTDAGDGGTSSSPVPTKWCVPNSGLSCPCNTQRDGVSHDCHNVNTFGDCAGKEKCDGKAGKWQGCTATVPKAEVCNNTDDNCNSKVDDGDPNTLCSSNGPPPPNSGWKCTAGTCAIGTCSPGWTAYPPGPLANGCQCPIDAAEPNGSCATAKDAGMVNDMTGSVLMQGTLSADNDVDFWTFNAVDINETTTNSYHVSIDFAGPTPNAEFLMDVVRGATCADVPSGASTALISYDWCVDGTGTGAGEKSCGSADGQTHCNDNSSLYFVRVYRKPGAMKTCTPYKITATAQGGDACDFAAQCP